MAERTILITFFTNQELKGNLCLTLSSVARDWLRKDRPAAEAWLPTSGIPADAIEKVTKPEERRRGVDFRHGE